MKKHTFLIAMVFVALAFVLFSCEGEVTQTIYKVSLDFNNGDEILETDIPAGMTFTIPKIVPVKENYEFDHWVCNGAEYKPGDKITVNSNLTVTAVWKEKAALKENEVRVTFILDGKAIKEQTIEKGKTVVAPTEGYTISEGYTLDGWYLDGAKFDFATAINNSITLTASIKKIRFTVTYVYNNGSENTTESVEWGSKVSKPNTPTYAGKSFGTWYSGETVYDFDSPVKENLTLTASWIDEGKVNVVIKYGNGTSDSVETKNKDTEYTLPDAPLREGYKFKAWSVGGINCTPGAKIVLTDSTIIKAVWEVNSSSATEEVTVTFVINESRLEKKVKKGETVVAPTTGYTIPEGYELEGWYIGDAKYNFSQSVNENITLTAKLNQTKYKVIFNLDGKKVKEVFVDKGKAVSEPDDIKTAEGYNLDGWYGSTMEKYNFTTILSSDITLNAKSVLKKVTVTFNPDNGTAASAKIVDWGTTVEEPSTPEAKSNDLKFDGWYSGETKFVFTEQVKENISLKARWITKGKVSVTVKYENGTEEKRAEYDEGVKFNLPGTPTYEGHTFLGWIIDNSTTTTPAGTEITLDSSKVITAKWDINKVKVTFNTGEGTTVLAKTLDWGDTLPDDITTTRDGYDFVGWKKGTETFNLTTQIKEDTELTAEWKIKTFTVTFMDGTTELGKQTVNWNATVSAIETPTKTGYTFSKWQKDGSEYNFDTPVTDNITLTASWTINKYEIKFDTGVEATIPSQTIEHGKKVIEPATDSLTKTGHQFDGWLNGTEKYDFDKAVEGPLTLTANWKKNKYAVVFTLDGKSTYDYIYIEYGNTVSPLTPNPTKEGYTFNKWVRNKDGVDYDFTTPITEILYLRADWTLNKYKVTFKNGDKTFKTEEVYYGTSVAEPENKPTSTDESKKFGFWSQYGTDPYNFESTVYSDTTLTAVFIDADEYIVTFDYDYEYMGNEVKTYNSNTTLTLPTNKTKGNYILSGWKGSDGNVYDAGASYTVTDSITFTAVWKQGVSVWFDYNDDSTYNYTVVPVGKTVTKPTDPTRENSTFVGWYDSNDILFDFTKTLTAGDTDIHLDAKYSPEYYIVTFAPDNGAENKVYNQIRWGETIDAEPDPKKDGFTFLGWFENESTEFDFTTNIKKDYTLTAHWSDSGTAVTDKCVVTYNFNDSSLENKSFTVKKGTTIYVGENIDTSSNHPEGKTFDYWKDESGNNADRSSVEINENCTFTAVWKTKQITVRFETYCDTTIPNQTVNWGEKVVEPSVPLTRDESEFVGWYWYNPSQGMYDFSTPVKQDYSLTLYALWDPEYFTVTFDPNNGEATWQQSRVSWAETASRPTDPVRNNCTFAGWYIDENTEYDFSSPVKKNITLTAKWVDVGTSVEGKCVVTYNFNDSTLSNETITVSKGTTINVGNGISTYSRHPEGKSLDYWADSKGNNVNGTSVEINEDCTFKAVWKDMTVEVDFNSEEGDIYKKVKWGEVITAPELSKEGYTFGGWSISFYGNEPYDFSKGIKPKHEYIDFYPIWTPLTYEVTVNANRGKDESTTQTVSYGTVLNLDTPERDGYKFLGWYDGSTEFDARTTPVTKDMTLIAKWSEEKVSKFNVVFCYLDGTSETVEVNYEETVTAPKEKTIDGLIFKGWYKGDSTLDPFIFTGNTFNFSTAITGDIYLYAKYNLSEDKLVGTWSANSVLDVQILKENGKNVVKIENKSAKNGKMVDAGTCNYNESTGKLDANFTGKYAAWMAGYPMYIAQNLGKTGENLITATYRDPRNYYAYLSSRKTPKEDNVIGTWTGENIEKWTNTITFNETQATTLSSLYSNREKNGAIVSQTKLITKYDLMDVNEELYVLFMNPNTGIGYEDTTATFSTSLTYAVDADTFYAIGFLGLTDTPLTRVK